MKGMTEDAVDLRPPLVKRGRWNFRRETDLPCKEPGAGCAEACLRPTFNTTYALTKTCCSSTPSAFPNLCTVLVGCCIICICWLWPHAPSRATESTPTGFPRGTGWC